MTSPASATALPLNAYGSDRDVSFKDIGVDAGVAEKLEMLGWKPQFGPRLNYPTILSADHLGAGFSLRDCILVVGDRYTISANHRTRVMLLSISDELCRAPGISSAVQQAVFGGNLLESPEPLKRLLKENYVPAPAEKQSPGIFVLERKSVVGQESERRGDRLYIQINQPVSPSDNPYVTAIQAWGLETLGYTLTPDQISYKAAHQSADVALSYIQDRARLEVVNTPSGPMFLVGEKGCDDSAMRYLASKIPHRKDPRQGGDKSPTIDLIRTLATKFNDELLERLTEPQCKLSATVVFPAGAKIDEGSCTFVYYRQQESRLSVPESEVFKVDLKRFGEGGIKDKFRDSFRNIHDDDTYLPNSIRPRALVDVGDQRGAMCGIGSVTGITSEMFFYVPKGESANFLVINGSDNQELNHMLYGVTVSRSTEGAYSFKPYKPETELIPLTSEGDCNYPAEVISKSA